MQPVCIAVLGALTRMQERWPLSSSSANFLSDQFRDRLAIIEQVLRTAVVIGNGRGGIYPKNVVKRRQKVLRRISASDPIFAGGVSRPNVIYDHPTDAE